MEDYTIISQRRSLMEEEFSESYKENLDCKLYSTKPTKATYSCDAEAIEIPSSDLWDKPVNFTDTQKFNRDVSFNSDSFESKFSTSENNNFEHEHILSVKGQFPDLTKSEKDDPANCTYQSNCSPFKSVQDVCLTESDVVEVVLNTLECSPVCLRNKSPVASPRLPKRQTKLGGSPKQSSSILTSFSDVSSTQSSGTKQVTSTPSVRTSSGIFTLDAYQASEDLKLSLIDVPPYDKSESGSSTSRVSVTNRSGARKWTWSNLISTKYKDRFEEFQRLFKLSPEEKLIADHACALQKEILNQGRLYISQNYICFYSKIFNWETTVVIRCKEITSITKEKTVRLIPNAIQICVDNNDSTEKYFFTTFAARDKAYMMMFRVWQNSLLNEPMSNEDFWRWVHESYGAELGLNSCDDDGLRAMSDLDKKEDCLGDANDDGKDFLHSAEPHIVPPDNSDLMSSIQLTPKFKSPSSVIPTDLSDSSDSCSDKNVEVAPHCSSPHKGKELLNTVLPVPVDTLFTWLFTKSKFIQDFHRCRKTTDLKLGEWGKSDSNANQKLRTNTYTMAITSSVARTSCVTETQVMNESSKPGVLYSVDQEVSNSGIPYAESFKVSTHFCLRRYNRHESRIIVFGEIKYKKSVWAVVKTMIEKSTWSGLEDYYSHLAKCLKEGTADSSALDAVHGIRTRKRTIKEGKFTGMEKFSTNVQRGSLSKGPFTVIPSNRNLRLPLLESRHLSAGTLPYRPRTEGGKSVLSVMTRSAGGEALPQTRLLQVVLAVLIVLIILNILLFVRMWRIESAQHFGPSFAELQLIKKLPVNKDEWLSLLKRQEQLHRQEMDTWRTVVETSSELLRQSEEALHQLMEQISQKGNITPLYAEKDEEL